MNTEIPTTDILDDELTPPLPKSLKVLTLLTFIGCGVSALLTLLMPMLYDLILSFLDKAKDSGKDFSNKEIADMEKAKAVIELAKQNAVPLLIIGLIGIALCFFGALWMRKLKKEGYWLYVAGEISPLIASVIILGSSQFRDTSSIIFSIAIPVVFVILYTLQRKHLVK